MGHIWATEDVTMLTVCLSYLINFICIVALSPSQQLWSWGGEGGGQFT